MMEQKDGIVKNVDIRFCKVPSHPVSVQLTNESLPYNGNQNFPDIQIKLANGKLLDDKYYTCVYEV